MTLKIQTVGGGLAVAFFDAIRVAVYVEANITENYQRYRLSKVGCSIKYNAETTFKPALMNPLR